MQPRQNIAKSTIDILEEELRKIFLNKSTEALKKMPVREILLGLAVEHINTFYKFGELDYIGFSFDEDKDRVKQNDTSIFYDNNNKENMYVWQFNIIHDYDNFCRKLPFWTLSLSIVHNNNLESTFIINPFLDISVFSEKGSGAINNQRKIRSDKEHFKLVFGSSPQIKNLDSFDSYINFNLNSVSVELIYLSCGYLDFYILSKEDLASYQECILVAKESGIIVTDCEQGYLLANEKVLKKLKN